MKIAERKTERDKENLIIVKVITKLFLKKYSQKSVCFNLFCFLKFVFIYYSKMPSRSQYSYLHGGHLESNLLTRTGLTSSSDISTSILNLELQRQNRRRHILRLEAHERNLANGASVASPEIEEPPK